MGFSFFFHGLGSSLITTVGSELPENITFQGNRQKKSAMGRSVPKRWAQVDFTGSLHYIAIMNKLVPHFSAFGVGHASNN